MSEVFNCPTCNHQSNIYMHPINPGITRALIKFKRAVIAKGENSVHTRRDMDGTPNELTKGEYANWTMLRYHGLVAKDKDAGAGYWLLTRRGNAYLKNEQAIPERVQVLNNSVIGHDEKLVTIQDVMQGDVPYFEEIATLQREAVPLNVKQMELFL